MFCKFSSEFVGSGYTVVDNIFINEFLPLANEQSVKVYLYGVYLCANNPSCTLEKFCSDLKLTADDVMQCMFYWQQMGLVQVISEDPFEVKFLPIRSVISNSRKYNKDEFVDFNIACQELIKGRMISSNEYTEYYTLIKSFGMEQNALLMIIRYCVEQKGDRVNSSYILTVAKDWAYSKILTEDAVTTKLHEMQSHNLEVVELFKMLNIKRAPSYLDYNQLEVWQKDLGFSYEVICFVAKQLKNKGGMEKLNQKLVKCYENRIFSIKEIEDFDSDLNTLTDLAKVIVKKLGLYYENYENVIKQYVYVWVQKGFSAEMLEEFADFCFKSNIRTLEGMNGKLESFFKLGIVSLPALMQYLADAVKFDSVIKNVLTACGLVRKVTASDREFYRVWSTAWNFSDEIILYVASLANGKMQPLSYINRVLANFKDSGVKSLEDAKKSATAYVGNQTTSNKQYVGRSYSKEELASLFDNIDEVNI